MTEASVHLDILTLLLHKAVEGFQDGSDVADPDPPKLVLQINPNNLENMQMKLQIEKRTLNRLIIC